MRNSKLKDNKIIKFIGALDAYLAMIVLLVVFALFCSGRVGWFLLIVAVGAPFLSVLWSILAAKFTLISVDAPLKIIEIGDEYSFRITVQTKGIFAAPLVRIKIKDHPRFSINQNVFKVSPSPFGMQEVVVVVSSAYAGRMKIEIEEIILSDFFGLIKFDLLKKCYPLCICANVLPRDCILQSEDEWLLEAKASAFDGEEPEESLDQASYMFGGFPGYDYREYIPGDPIKRINYKLSARLGKYQIRLDEKQAVAGISLFISTAMPENPSDELQKQVIAQNECVHNVYAIAKHLFMKDFAVTVIISDEHILDIKRDEDFGELRQILAGVSFGESKLPEISRIAKGTLIAVSCYVDAMTSDVLEGYRRIDGNVVTHYISSTGEGKRL